MSNDKDTVVSISVIGFFTFMMFWTLNGSGGRDMNDVVVDYVIAKTKAIEVVTTSRNSD